MEKLYGILNDCREGIKIIDLEIEKETNKTYKLKQNPIASIVRKSALPFYKTYNGAVTTDLKIGKEKWNKLLENEIESLENKIKNCKNMIISN